MRKPIIAGNWKMFTTLPEARALATGLKDALGGAADVDVVLIPPFPLVAAVVEAVAGSPIEVGAQNLFVGRDKDGQPTPFGAFTGEVSAPMIRSVGATYVVIGHSERRQYFGETDDGVNAKVHAALAAGLKPIVCVGERLDEREAGTTLAVVERQVLAALAGVPDAVLAELVLAYEPVWAIGTGRVATDAQAQEVHAFIRGLIRHERGAAVAEGLRIQYGGSVKADNAKGLLGQRDIDGALVGGASLKVDSFLGIIRGARG